MKSSKQTCCQLSFTLHFVLICLCIYYIECTDYSVGLEKLIDTIFNQNAYNQLVRPTDPESGLTIVFTELKLLQIDLVGLLRTRYFNYSIYGLLFLVHFKSGWEIPRAGFDCLDWNGNA